MKYLIAFSGGLDSSVLLKLFHEQHVDEQIHIRVIHIHHGLQTAADQWTDHCQKVCNALNIPLIIKKVNATARSGESPEATARRARYQAFSEVLTENEVLVTAHHKNDQAETLLLHLVRGAGSHGLAAMPALKPFANGWHWRPLLDFSRQQLEEYAQQHQLQWIDDVSNQDIHFDRNYLRHEVLPLLAKRWPAVVQNLNRVANIQAEINDFLETLLQPIWKTQAEHLTQINIHPKFAASLQAPYYCLPYTLLENLPNLLQKYLLRHWIKSTLGITISQQQLTLIENEVIHAARHKTPQLKLRDFYLKRFADALWLVKSDVLLNNPLFMSVHLNQALSLPGQNFILTSEAIGLKIAADKITHQKLSLRFRQGNEDFHPLGREHSQSLKKLLHEWRIPPWLRNQIPLLYADEELIAIGDLFVAKNYATSLNNKYVFVKWDIEV